jgi:hypothetical protein
MNMVQTFDLIETTRRDQNGSMQLDYRNEDAGSSARIEQRFVTNAATLYMIAASTAGGAFASMDWQGSGGFFINGNGGISFQTGNSTKLSVEASGAVRAVSPTGGLGYGAGAGGTVTQATSKSTAVTLNKVCGRITTHNATLNAGAEVGFTVNNSAVEATDVLIVNMVSGGSFDSYHFQVDAISAGSFRISITNISASNLGEALVLNFAVIKAVTA